MHTFLSIPNPLIQLSLVSCCSKSKSEFVDRSDMAPPKSNLIAWDHMLIKFLSFSKVKTFVRIFRHHVPVYLLTNTDRKKYADFLLIPLIAKSFLPQLKNVMENREANM